LQDLLRIGEKIWVAKPGRDVADVSAGVRGNEMEKLGGGRCEQLDPKATSRKTVAISVQVSKLAMSLLALSSSSIFS
jgi:hypothetical protein